MRLKSIIAAKRISIVNGMKIQKQLLIDKNLILYSRVNFIEI